MNDLVLAGVAFAVTSGLHFCGGYYVGRRNNDRLTNIQTSVLHLQRLLRDYAARVDATLPGQTDMKDVAIPSIRETLEQIPSELSLIESERDVPAGEDSSTIRTDQTTETPESENTATHAPAVEPLRSPGDRRRSPRYPFRIVQPIAPYDSGCFPEKDEFQPVQFWDLSGEGVSFILPQPPRFEFLVTALGVGDDPWYLTARVMRVTPFTERGREEYLVGCEFLGKLKL